MGNKQMRLVNIKRRLHSIVVASLVMFIFLSQMTMIHAANKTVRVACDINYSLYYDDNGKIQGYCADYLKALANINHWNIEYVSGNWDQSLQRLEDGEIDLLFPAQKTEEREKTLSFSNTIGGYQPLVLASLKTTDIYYEDFESIDGKRIAVSKDSSNEAELKAYALKNHFSYTPVYIAGIGEKKQILKEGKADLFVTSTLTNMDDLNIVAMLNHLPFYYTVNKNNPTLLKELNDGMKELLVQQPQLVSQVYNDFLSKGISMAFTQEEHDYVEKKDSIKVGFYQDTAPLSDVKDGTSYGIYVDYLKLLEEKTGMKIQLYPIQRPTYAYDLLDSGEIDFVMGSNDVTFLENGSSQYTISQPVMDYTTVAISKQNFQFDKDTSFVFALTSARKYWETYIEENYPKATIEYMSDAKSCLIAVQSGKANVTLLNTLEYNYQSKNTRFDDLIEWENFRISSHMVMVSRNDVDPILLNIINKGIQKISDRELIDISSYNLNMSYHSYTFDDTLYNMRTTIIFMVILVLLILIALCFFLNIRHKYVRELEKQNEKLEKANESKTQFLSRMSHELRTPLNAIVGYTSLLESDALDEQKEYIKEIQNAAHHQLDLVGDILDIQQIETGQLELHKERFSTDSFMKEIAGTVESEIYAKNIQFTYMPETPFSEYYYGDRERIKQIIIHILSNAIKFTLENGTITFMTQAEVLSHKEVKLTFKVKDSGIGMSQDFIDHNIFRPFSQENNLLTSPYQGMGIGLSTSRSLARNMGGDITVTSEKNVGSIFTFTTIVETISNGRVRESITTDGYNLQGLSILLVEDNPTNQKITKRLLEKMNAHVDIAEDGLISVQKMKEQPSGYYDLVLMDIRMPNMDGLEATRQIRLLENGKDIPIVALSANAFEEDIRKSLAAGMNDHLAKPIDARILFERLIQYKN